MDAAAINKRNKTLALAYTLGFHALLLLLFFFIVFITPIPPFEVKPEAKLELELGFGIEGLGHADAGGSGNHNKEVNTTTEKVKSTTNKATAPDVMTNDDETSVAVKTNKKKKNVKADAPIVKEEKEDADLVNALAKLHSKKQHRGQGEGSNNDGGSGNGNNGGVGDGNSTGHGNGTPGFNGNGGYDLVGRNIRKRPAHMTDSEDEGIVVVEIIVDAEGNVIKATPGMRGSTTTSAKLFSKARLAALQAKFSESSDGVKEQRGTYTFIFTLD